jgi:hypothetical protein
MVLEDRVDGSSTSAFAKCIRVVRIVLELLLFEKLFYYGCSSRKHTAPACVLGKVDSGFVLVAGIVSDRGRIKKK